MTDEKASTARGCGWTASESTTFLVTSGMSSLFFFFFENYGELGKVSYAFFFLFQNIFLFKDYFI